MTSNGPATTADEDSEGVSSPTLPIVDDVRTANGPENVQASTSMMDGSQHWAPIPQLPTPVTFDDIQVANQPSVEASASNIDFDDSYLADFLKDVMNPADPLADHAIPDNHELGFTKDFLDFNLPTSFEYLDGFDIPQFQQDVNVPPDTAPQPRAEQSLSRSGYATPTGRTGLGVSAQAFKESLWLWTPQQGEHAQAEHANLSIPVESFISMEREGLGQAPFPPLGQTARDRILATVLNSCDRTMAAMIVASFPSAELLTVLVHKWIVYHKHQTDTWFHLADFDPNVESPELLLGITAFGGFLSKNPRVRKLGNALQESARAAIGVQFEGDNRHIRSLRPMQALALQQDVGLWSGDRRKVELSESFAQTLVTMFRRGNGFTKSDELGHIPALNDDGNSIDRKWRAWIQAESFQRLALHLLIRDAQTSSSLLNPPLVSFSEITCPLPAVRAVWMAQTAAEWSDLMRSFGVPPPAKVPSLRSCLHNLPSMAASRRFIDIELAILAVANAFWGPCWHHRQVEAIARRTWDDLQQGTGFVSNTTKQTAVQGLQQFRLLISEVHESRPEATLTTERVLMNLHVSLEDVQLLAGKAGEKEARRTLSTLKHWSRSPDSRQAIWHAGQLIRAAREYANRTLREASAVAVYHASLVMWAYSILTHADRPNEEPHGSSQENQLVLNDAVSPYVERFVMLGRGSPVLRTSGLDHAGRQRANSCVPLNDAKKVMKAIVDMLHANNGVGDESPPLVENLTKLMRSLGNAARSIRAVET